MGSISPDEQMRIRFFLWKLTYVDAMTFDIVDFWCSIKNGEGDIVFRSYYGVAKEISPFDRQQEEVSELRRLIR